MPKTGVALFSLVLVILVSTFTETKSIHNRAKRQIADIKTAEYLAWLGLGGVRSPYGCRRVACGVVDVHSRVRRSGADQRIAELQALIALTNNGGMVAHGQFDPLRIGKRNGDDVMSNLDLADRYQLWRSILEKGESKA